MCVVWRAWGCCTPASARWTERVASFELSLALASSEVCVAYSSVDLFFLFFFLRVASVVYEQRWYLTCNAGNLCVTLSDVLSLLTVHGLCDMALTLVHWTSSLMHLFMCVCMRACVRVCVGACVCMCLCTCVCDIKKCRRWAVIHFCTIQKSRSTLTTVSDVAQRTELLVGSQFFLLVKGLLTVEGPAGEPSS